MAIYIQVLVVPDLGTFTSSVARIFQLATSDQKYEISVLARSDTRAWRQVQKPLKVAALM